MMYHRRHLSWFSNSKMEREFSNSEFINVQFCGQIDSLKILTKEGITCEQALITCVKHVHAYLLMEDKSVKGPMFLPAFGLVSYPEERQWLSHNHKFKRRCEDPRVFKFRVRFRLPSNRFRESDLLTEYLFQQVRDDFLHGQLGTHENLSEEDIFHGLALAFLIPKTSPATARNTQLVDQTFEESSLSLWGILWNQSISAKLKRRISKDCLSTYVLSSCINEQIERLKAGEEKQSVWAFKKTFYNLLMNAVQDYVFEEYRPGWVKTDTEDTVTVSAKLGLVEELGQEPALYFGKDYQCMISDIEMLRLCKPTDLCAPVFQVIVELKKEPPKILSFMKGEEAESFISMVQGCYSLYVRYNTCLNTDLRTTRAKISEQLKSFGPIHPQTAERHLRDSRGVQNPSGPTFLIHESLTDFGHYTVVIKPAQTPDSSEELTDSLRKLDVEIAADLQLVLRQHEGMLNTFSSSSALRQHLASSYGQQLPPRCYHSVADINEIYIEQMIDDYILAEDDPWSGRPSIYLRDDLSNKEEIRDKNPQIRKFKVNLPDGRQATLVELRTDEGKINMAFREGTEKLIKLGRIDPSRFLQLYGTVVEKHICLLMEYTPLADLLTYVCSHHQRIIQTIHIMYQILKILQIMGEKHVYHGNVRLRKFMVFGSVSQEFVTVKLGDPGISSHFDDLPLSDVDNVDRFPWLSPERRTKLHEITYESECYAVGTTLCELLYRNDQFHEELKLGNQQELVSYLEQHKHLPPPGKISQTVDDQVVRAEDDAGDRLTTKAREVLTSVWNDIILQCWAEVPAERPAPEKLVQDLSAIRVQASQISEETHWESIKQVAYDMGLKEQLELESKNMSLAELQHQIMIRSREQYLDPKFLDVTKKMLGAGNFGVVYEGFITRPPRRKVAVKKLKKDKMLEAYYEQEQKQFLKEIQRAIHFKHPNIVRVLHVSKSSDSERDKNSLSLMLIMEYMNEKSLKDFAVNNPIEKHPENTVTMLQIALDVVKGMVYLSSNGIVHRDLAARNVLLCRQDGGRLTGKVSDFGLARYMDDRYGVRQILDRPFPIWPPECLLGFEEDGSAVPSTSGQGQKVGFSSKGDVWSFGTMLWEIFSNGTKPINALPADIRETLRNSNIQALDKLHKAYSRGWRFEHKPYVTQQIYDVMSKCWAMEPENRPTFEVLQQTLEELIQVLSLWTQPVSS